MKIEELTKTQLRKFLLKTVLRCLVMVSVLLSASACSKGVESVELTKEPQHLVDATLASSSPFEPRGPEEWVLANGLRVIFVRDQIVPLVKGTLYLPGGSVFEPGEVAGLASAVGDQMRDGSVIGVSPEDMDRRLDALGAAIEAGYDAEYGSVSFSCLSEDFHEVADLFGRVVRTPAFDQARLKLWKEIAVEGIKRRKDDPDTMASMVFNTVLYGDNEAYNRVPIAETLLKIDRTKLIEFHRRFVRPNGAILALTGDIDPQIIKNEIEKNFISWERVNEPLAKLPTLQSEPKPGVYLLQRDFDQSSIVIGHLGPPRVFPEMYSISVFNRIFGVGGMETKLFSDLRTRRGLAYSVYGGVFPGAVAGNVSVQMGTKRAQTALAVRKAIDLIDGSLQVLESEEAVNLAKQSVSQGFVFKFATPTLVVNRVALMNMLGYPEDFDRTYLSRMSGVTPDSVLTAVRRWLDPHKLAVVVVGQVSADEILEKLGQKMDVFKVTFDEKPIITRVQTD